jgi:hypothetical protein
LKKYGFLKMASEKVRREKTEATIPLYYSAVRINLINDVYIYTHAYAKSSKLGIP